MLVPSYGSFLSCFICGNLFLFCFCFLSKNKGSINIRTLHFFTFGTILIMLRMFFPCNFFFTHNIYNKKILVPLLDFLTAKILGQFSILNIMIIISIVGFIVRFGLFVYRQFRFYRLMSIYPKRVESNAYIILKELKGKYHIDKEIALIETSIVKSPCIVGLLHPTILLPRLNFSNKELYYILEHELQHFRHHDLWILTICEICICIYWWNPLCYLLKKQIQQTLEVLNDNTIAANFSPSMRLEYMKCLLKVASIPQPKIPCGTFLAMEDGISSLEQRFYFLTKKKNTKKILSIPRILNVIFFSICLFLSVFFAFEPAYDIPESISKTTVGLEKNRTFFIRNNQSYDIYYDGKIFSTIDNLDSFPGYKVYSNKEEAQKYEKMY